MKPFPIVQKINGIAITFYQTEDYLVYPIRELKMPDGSIWQVSEETFDLELPEEADASIAFYFPAEDLFGGTDKELLDLIGETT